MNELAKTYEEIAMEREHICTGCLSNKHLSHSHLVPKGHNQSLKAVKENITYHCFFVPGNCHDKWEGVEFWKLIDFIPNMKYVYSVDTRYFWLRVYNAVESYVKIIYYLSPASDINYSKLKVEEAKKAIQTIEDMLKIILGKAKIWYDKDGLGYSFVIDTPETK